MILVVPEKANAESARSYLYSAKSKYESKDYDGSIYDLIQAINRARLVMVKHLM